MSRVIIAGSRSITDPQLVVEAVAASGIIPTVVLSGRQRGVDQLGEQWADANGIPWESYPADWDRYGPKAAGPIRNSLMADNGEALIAIWDGVSSGTRDMIKKARKLGLKVYVHETQPSSSRAGTQGAPRQEALPGFGCAAEVR